jgi:hypothetical protein
MSGTKSKVLQALGSSYRGHKKTLKLNKKGGEKNETNYQANQRQW